MTSHNGAADPLRRLDDALEKMAAAINILRSVVTEMREDVGTEEGHNGTNSREAP